MKNIATGLIVVLLMGFSMVSMAADTREDIHASADQVQPLMVGMKAPDFTVRNVEGQAFKFESGAQAKPIVLTFFRGGWCPYCNLHLSELRLAEKQLEEMGFNIWFISIDKPELLLESLDDPDIGYTIYSDSSLSATRAFGLAFRVDDELYARYLGYDINLEMASGETHHVLPAPARLKSGCITSKTDGHGYSRCKCCFHFRMHAIWLLKMLLSQNLIVFKPCLWVLTCIKNRSLTTAKAKLD